MLKKIFPVLLINFVNVLSFAILMPILPYLVESYGGGNLTYGILLASFSLCQFLAAPFWGALSDRYGRKPVLIISQAGTLLSWIIFGIAYFLPHVDFGSYSLPLVVILFSRIVDGITGGNMAVANAYVADVVDNGNRTKAFGIFGATFGVGFLVGPSLGALSSSTSIGYLGTAILATIISILALLFLFTLKETLKEEHRAEHLDVHILRDSNLVRRFKHLSLSFEMNKLFAYRGVFSLAFTAYTTVLILYLKDTFGYKELGVGVVLFVIGMFGILNQGFLVSKLSKKFTESRVFMTGYFALALFLPFLLIKMPIVFALVLFYFLSFSIDVCAPTFKSLISQNVGVSRQGEALGLDQSMSAFGRAIAPLLAAYGYEYMGNYVFLIISGVLVFPAVLFLAYNKLLYEPS